MAVQYTAVYEKTDKWVIAWVEEIRGVNTQGRSMEEARATLREALELILDANRELSDRDAGPDAVKEPLLIERPR